MSFRIGILCFVSLLLSNTTLAQETTALKIYNIVQNKCVSCHNTSDAAGGLDLSVNAQSVYDRLVGEKPNNAAAAAKGYNLIEEGQPYRSFFFKKIQNGICKEDCDLDEGERDVMPNTHAILTEVEAELVRQWIYSGASPTESIDETAFTSYYMDGGLERIERPAPPPEGQGYQIHLGPIFINPNGEEEYFIKYPLNLPDDLEVTRLAAEMNDFSHHFIMYKFVNNTETEVVEGLRNIFDFGEAFAGNSRMVSAWQYNNDIKLPPGTAFFWDKNDVIDLNYHIPNYSSAGVLASDLYINVYTQPKGVAVREMKSDLLDYVDQNDFFVIPRNTENYTLSYTEVNNQQWNIWLLGSHTHKLGVDYDIYRRAADGSRGEQIFEGTVDGYYDWSHPPTNYYEPFLVLEAGEGLIQEAKYTNPTDNIVSYGVRTTNEMFLSLLLYVEGENFPFVSIAGVGETYCEGDAKALINAEPSGGTLSGTGVNGLFFDPALAGVGTHLISYEYPFEGKMITATKEITINAAAAKPSITQNGEALSTTIVDGVTYQWYADGQAIDGANSAEHTATTSGTYTVAIIPTDGSCAAFSDAIEVAVSSIDDLPQVEEFQVYPNPYKEQFAINYTLTKTADVRVQLYNISGQSIHTFVKGTQNAATYQYTSNTLDVELAKGLYFVEIEIDGQVFVEKLIKQ